MKFWFNLLCFVSLCRVVGFVLLEDGVKRIILHMWLSIRITLWKVANESSATLPEINIAPEKFLAERIVSPPIFFRGELLVSRMEGNQ